MSPRRPPRRDAPQAGRFLRREGNLKVRRERRQRRMARIAGRITVAVVVVGLGVVAVGSAARWVSNTPALAVEHLRVEGETYADARTLRALAAVPATENLTRVDLDRVADAVATHPWVKQVVVQRRFPDTLVVQVQERSPRAIALIHGEAFLLDADGARIDRFGPRYSEWSFPVLIGLDALQARERRARCAMAGTQLELLRGAAPDIYARVAAADLSDPDVTVLSMEDNREQLRVAPEEWTKNLTAYQALRPAFVQRHGAMRYVDLRWNGRVVVMDADGKP